ncbi:MAG: threonylcarbamoyl-AMP synthase [Thermoplasmata archaeon]|nr:threonylcarbamoyl-AMP synthase [Thermoplasmata archaeon]
MNDVSGREGARLFECGTGSLSKEDLTWLAKTVLAGGVLVYPTETLYGLGADPRNKEAVERIFRLKNRPLSDNMSVAFYSQEEVEEWVEIPQTAKELMKKHCPGPLTVLVPRRETKQSALPPSQLFGIRIPSHPIARQILSVTGPLLSTSANRHGNTPSEEEAMIVGEGCEAIILAHGVAGEGSTVVSVEMEEKGGGGGEGGGRKGEDEEKERKEEGVGSEEGTGKEKEDKARAPIKVIREGSLDPALQ